MIQFALFESVSSCLSLRGRVSFLEIVFVGQCEVFVLNL